MMATRRFKINNASIGERRTNKRLSVSSACAATRFLGKCGPETRRIYCDSALRNRSDRFMGELCRDVWVIDGFVLILLESD